VTIPTRIRVRQLDQQRFDVCLHGSFVTPFTACRDGHGHGPVFPGGVSAFGAVFTNSQTCSLTRISTIRLVLDPARRRGRFDLGNSQFIYPSGCRRLGNPLQLYFTPPSATPSRCGRR